jgi:hypothetical protein
MWLRQPCSLWPDTNLGCSAQATRQQSHNARTQCRCIRDTNTGQEVVSNKIKRVCSRGEEDGSSKGGGVLSPRAHSGPK